MLIGGAWRPAAAGRADVADVAQAQACVAAVIAEFRRVDSLVNAAGLTTRGTLLDTTPDLFDAHIAVNLKAPFFLMQAVTADLVARKAPGTIVNIGSTSAHVGQPYLAPYVAAKAGLAGRGGRRAVRRADRRQPRSDAGVRSRWRRHRRPHRHPPRAHRPVRPRGHARVLRAAGGTRQRRGGPARPPGRLPRSVRRDLPGLQRARLRCDPLGDRAGGDRGVRGGQPYDRPNQACRSPTASHSHSSWTGSPPRSARS
jgi:short chain dehydrogenase